MSDSTPDDQIPRTEDGGELTTDFWLMLW